MRKLARIAIQRLRYIQVSEMIFTHHLFTCYCQDVFPTNIYLHSRKNGHSVDISKKSDDTKHARSKDRVMDQERPMSNGKVPIRWTRLHTWRRLECTGRMRPIERDERDRAALAAEILL